RQVLHRRGPMHVAVAHQRELAVDAFGRKRLGQRLVNRHVLHGAVLLNGGGTPGRPHRCLSIRPGSAGIVPGGPGSARTLPLTFPKRKTLASDMGGGTHAVKVRTAAWPARAN